MLINISSCFLLGGNREGYSLGFRRELEEIKLKVLPAKTTALNLSSPCFLEVDQSPSSFVAKPPQVQNTGPTFSVLEMDYNRMSFRNFLPCFENCLAGMDNNAKSLNFLKCSLSGRPLLLINHLRISNKNYCVALTVPKNEYLDENEIISVTVVKCFSCLMEKIILFSSFPSEIKGETIQLLGKIFPLHTVYYLV